MGPGVPFPCAAGWVESEPSTRRSACQAEKAWACFFIFLRCWEWSSPFTVARSASGRVKGDAAASARSANPWRVCYPPGTRYTAKTRRRIEEQSGRSALPASAKYAPFYTAANIQQKSGTLNASRACFCKKLILFRFDIIRKLATMVSRRPAVSQKEARQI